MNPSRSQSLIRWETQSPNPNLSRATIHDQEDHPLQASPHQDFTNHTGGAKPSYRQAFISYMFLARRITKEPSIESHGLITGLQLIRTPVHRTAAVMFIDDGLTREYAELWHHIMCILTTSSLSSQPSLESVESGTGPQERTSLSLPRPLTTFLLWGLQIYPASFYHRIDAYTTVSLEKFEIGSPRHSPVPHDSTRTVASISFLHPSGVPARPCNMGEPTLVVASWGT